MTGFVFKIQANMDPNHRDRIAFMRVCSGKLDARHAGQAGAHRQADRRSTRRSSSSPRTARSPRRPSPATSSASPTTALLRIGDTLTEGEDIVFRGVPSFAPEILRRVKLADAMKAKKLREALQQMAEEGVVQVFLPHDGSGAIVGVVGALQLDVLAERLQAEYGLPVSFEHEPLRDLPLGHVGETGRSSTSSSTPIRPRWPPTSTARRCSWRRSAFNLRYEQERWPKIAFSDVKDYQRAGGVRC